LVIPTGVQNACPVNDKDCLTRPNWAIEAKGGFRGLSNRTDPPPETKTAAPVGAGNGGNQIGKTSYGSDNFSITGLGQAASDAIEIIRRLPTIAAVDSFMRDVWGRYTGEPGQDELVEALNSAAIARRTELRELGQAGAKKARGGAFGGSRHRYHLSQSRCPRNAKQPNVVAN
jgi:hypothetical protein